MALQIQEEEIKEQQNEPVNVGGVIINSSKAPRLPRWTRQEILVLIQGKRVAEKRVRRGRTAALTNGGSVEPKWATVSSYCKRHGVNRGPVQCRKRWSNLAGDFKKIKEWESQSNIKDGGESFWVMRNDLRRERKLPGFFDKEVYDILDGSAPLNSSSAPLDDDDDNNENNNNSIINKEHEIEVNDDDGYGNDENESEAAVAGGGAAPVVLFDSGRSAAADDGLFSDFEQSHSVQDEEDQNRTPDHRNKDAPSGIPMSIPAPTPISEKQYEPFTGGGTAPGNNEKQAAANPEMGSTSQEGRKRRRFFTEDDAEADEDDRDRERDSLHNQLVNVLERNGRILTAQLEAHNINLKLDREERKDHANSLVAVLNKLADALGRIADKL